MTLDVCSCHVDKLVAPPSQHGPSTKLSERLLNTTIFPRHMVALRRGYWRQGKSLVVLVVPFGERLRYDNRGSVDEGADPSEVFERLGGRCGLLLRVLSCDRQRPLPGETAPGSTNCLVQDTRALQEDLIGLLPHPATAAPDP